MIGIQPTPTEVRAFLADKGAGKRLKVVDSLFERPEYVDHWSLKWGDLLQNSRNSTSSPAVYQFREFIRGAVAANTPIDQFARKILTAKGGITDDPAAVYFAVSKDLNDTVERVTQVFCGVRMLCARCHTHPLENWTQADYYGLASFFSQVNMRADPHFLGAPNTKILQLNLKASAARASPDRPTSTSEVSGWGTTDIGNRQGSQGNLRQLVDFPEKPVLRAVWSTVSGAIFSIAALSIPWTTFAAPIPPINPALLDALTADFIQHKFDVRHLIRTIVSSATYQRTTLPNASNQFDEQNFSACHTASYPGGSAYRIALVQATAVPESFGGVPGGSALPSCRMAMSNIHS